MPVKGIQRLKLNMGLAIGARAGKVTDAAVYQVLQAGAFSAATMTPVDTSNLINSQTPPQVANGKGTIGYTAAYAKYVHEAKGTLKGQPRTGGTGVGNYWEPTGEPQFLRKGFEEIKADIPRILKAAYAAK